MAFGYKKWLAQRIAELEQGAEVVETARGPVEYQRRGFSAFVLFFSRRERRLRYELHQRPPGGGWLRCVSALRVRVTCRRLSRPEEPTRNKPMRLAALLDAIEVEQVAVHGISAGGPAAIQFAARHPDRARGLLLTSAISTVYPYDFPLWGRVAVGSNLGSWLTLRMFEKFPKVLLTQALDLTSTYSADERKRMAEKILSTPKWLEFFRRMTVSSTPAGLLKEGFFNDLEQYKEIEKNGLPLEQIRCPTLIVHGTADGDVKFVHAETSHRRIPNAELHKMEGAYHLVWLSELADETYRDQIEFLKTHLGQPAAERLC